MSQYKPRTKRIEPGVYTLTYGKGKKKLTDTLHQNEEGWVVSGRRDLGTHPTKKAAKETWGYWAEANYDNVNAPYTPLPADLPAFTPPPPPTFSTPSPEPNDQTDYEFLTDPFDPRYRYPEDHEDAEKAGHLTPVGVLAEIDAWRTRQDTIPPAFQPLIQSVRDCLQREIELEPPSEGDHE